MFVFLKFSPNIEISRTCFWNGIWRFIASAFCWENKMKFQGSVNAEYGFRYLYPFIETLPLINLDFLTIGIRFGSLIFCNELELNCNKGTDPSPWVFCCSWDFFRWMYVPVDYMFSCRFPEVLLIDGMYRVNRSRFLLYTIMLCEGNVQGKAVAHALLTDETFGCTEGALHSIQTISQRTGPIFYFPSSLLKLSKLWDPNFSFNYLKQIHFPFQCFENLLKQWT